MTTDTVTLASWLLERIAADEAVARAAGGATAWRWKASSRPWNGTVEADGPPNNPDDLGIIVYDEGRPSDEEAAHIAHWDPIRVLAECEAKRRIVQAATFTGNGTYNETLLGVLRLLTFPYADHPDYREEWRP